MSGFLTHLLRKERSSKLSLRPRVGSRFETPLPTGGPDPLDSGPEKVDKDNMLPPMEEVPHSAPTREPSRGHGRSSTPVSGSLPEGAKTSRPERHRGEGLEEAARGGTQASTLLPSARPAHGARGMQRDGRLPKAGPDGIVGVLTSTGVDPGPAADQTGQTLGRPPGPRSHTEDGAVPERSALQGQGDFPHTSPVGSVRRASALRGANPEEGIRQSARDVPSPRERASNSPATHDLSVETPTVSTDPSAADLDGRRPVPRAAPMGALRGSVHHGQFSPGSGPRGPEEARSGDPPPSPVIRVSIGRIEVRAQTPERVKPQAAPPRSSPYRPPLTLNDYLKRRSGGS